MFSDLSWFGVVYLVGTALLTAAYWLKWEDEGRGFPTYLIHAAFVAFWLWGIFGVGVHQ